MAAPPVRRAELFVQEFAAATETLSTHPRSGARVRRHRVKGLRRVRLRATRNPVYFVATERTVLVLAIWSAVRGSGPPISQLHPAT